MGKGGRRPMRAHARAMEASDPRQNQRPTVEALFFAGICPRPSRFKMWVPKIKLRLSISFYSTG